MEEQLPKMNDKLLFRVYTRLPTMVGPQGKSSNLGSPDAWNMLSSGRLLHVEYKNKLSSFLLK